MHYDSPSVCKSCNTAQEYAKLYEYSGANSSSNKLKNCSFLDNAHDIDYISLLSLECVLNRTGNGTLGLISRNTNTLGGDQFAVADPACGLPHGDQLLCCGGVDTHH